MAGGEKVDVWHSEVLAKKEWVCTHLQDFKDEDADTCKQRCLGNTACGGVTWNADTKACYLVDWVCTSDPNRKGVTKAGDQDDKIYSMDSYYIARNVWKANVKGKGAVFSFCLALAKWGCSCQPCVLDRRRALAA